jgi:hypothetical protein
MTTTTTIMVAGEGSAVARVRAVARAVAVVMAVIGKNDGGGGNTIIH